MWTPTIRRQHSRAGLHYGCDLTDSEWKSPAPLLPGDASCGRKRALSVREIVNAIGRILRGGITWKQFLSEAIIWAVRPA